VDTLAGVDMPKLNTISELLEQIPLFGSLGKEAIGRLAESVRIKSLEQGQVLFNKGDEGSSMYIINEGAIKIVLPSSVGEEIIVALLGKNDFFGAMAMLDGEPRSADAVAVNDASVLTIGRSDFLSILQEDRQALKTILCDLSKMIRRTDDFLEDICFFNISTRLAKKLIDLSDTVGVRTGEDHILIDLSLTQKELGDMVGATRESVNKELKVLRQNGMIDVKGNKITIIDFDMLEERVVL
jgi:CRP-like cAMP-binding protein